MKESNVQNAVEQAGERGSSKSAAPRRRRWWRRLLLGALLLALVGRVLLGLGLEPGLAAGARAAGIDLETESVRLRMLAGEIELVGLSAAVRPADGQAGAEPFLTLEYARVDLDTRALLRGRVRVARIDVDGLQVELERGPKGTLTLLEELGLGGDGEQRPEREPSDDAGRLSLASPVELGALRVQRFGLGLTDRTVEPAVRVRLEAALGLSGVGADQERGPARLELWAAAEAGPEGGEAATLIDRLELNGTLELAPERAVLALAGHLGGLRPGPVAALLAGLGLAPLVDEFDGSFALDAHLDVIDAATGELAAGLALRDLTLSGDGRLLAGLAEVSVELASLSPERIDLARIQVQGGRLGASLEPGSHPAALGFAWIGPQHGVERAPAEAGGGRPASAAGAAETAPSLPALRLAKLIFSDLALEFVDASLAEPVHAGLALTRLELTDLELGRDGSGPARLELEAEAPGLARTLSLAGELAFGERTGRIDLVSGAREVSLVSLAPYLAAAGFDAAPEPGSFEARLSAGFELRAGGGLAADAKLADLRLQAEDGGDADAFERWRIERIECVGLEVSSSEVALGALEVEGARIGLRRDERGLWHVLGLVQRPGGAIDPPRAALAPWSPLAAGADRAPGASPARSNHATPDAPGYPADAPGPAPRIRLDRLALIGVGLDLLDEHVVAEESGARAEPLRLSLTDSRLELLGLALGGPADGPAPPPAKIAGTFRAPGLVERLELNGEIESRPGDLDLELSLRVEGDGLAPAALADLLPESAPRPHMRAGHLGFHLAAALESSADGLAGSFALRDLSLEERGAGEVQPLARLEALELERFSFGPAGTDLGPLSLRGPELWIERAADGSLSALGWSLAAAAPAATAPEEIADPTGNQPAAEPVRGRLGGGGGSSDPEPPRAESPAFAAGPLRLEGLVLHLADWASAGHDSAAGSPGDGRGGAPHGSRAAEAGAAAEPAEAAEPVEAAEASEVAEASEAPEPADTAPLAPAEPNRLRLALGADLGRLDLGRPAAGVPFGLRLAVTDAIGELALDGQLLADPASPQVQGELTGREITFAALAPFLPAGMEAALADGRLDGRFAFEASLPAGEPFAVALALSDFAFRDGDGEPLAALTSLRLVAPKLDAEGGHFLLEELAAEGLRLHAERQADGSLLALGLRIAPPATTPPATAPPSTANGTANGTAREGNEEAPAPALESAAAAEPDASVAARDTTPLPWPKVELGRLALEVERLRFVDHFRPNAQNTTDGDAPAAETRPLDLALSLQAGPQVLLDAEPEALAPLSLLITGSIAPFCRDFAIDLALAPYEDEPSFAIAGRADGLDAAGLVEALPMLAAWLAPGNLADGRASGRARGELTWRRRGPLDFDLASGFGAELWLEDLELLAGPEGPPLLGLGALHVEAQRVQPASGDVHLASVEIVRPLLRASLEPEGLRIAGFVLDLNALAGEPQSEASPGGAAADPPAPAPEPNSTARAPEVRLDSLVLRDIDVHVADRTATPPVVLPLDRLDGELRGFTTRAFTEPMPIQFGLYMGAGPVELPRRVPQRSLIGGFASAAGSALAGRRERVELEERRLFDELALSGRVVLVPAPTGWVRLDIEGFELTGLRGSAADSGVEIGDGLFDGRVRVRLEGERGMLIDSHSTFTYLSLSEPAGGPISRYLRLPAPLDTVLFVLRNEDGEQRIPMRFRVGSEGLSLTSVTTAAVGALGSLITNAIASSPLRITGGLTDMLGFGGQRETGPAARETTTLNFESGSAELSPAEAARLDAVVARLRRDPELRVLLEHRFGVDDLERARVLANPSEGKARELGKALGVRRAELLRERDEQSARARALYQLGSDSKARDAAHRLRDLDAELGRVEEARDRVYELLRPGAERREERRTRAAAFALAEWRQAAVREVLLAAEIDDLEERLETRRPRFEVALDDEGDALGRGSVIVTERGGSPRRGFFGRIFGLVGF